MPTSTLRDQIHSKALEISTRYKRAEGELIDILLEVDRHHVFVHRGHASLFAYVVKELGLSESVAYSLITVSRKARQIPELKREIQKGSITLSNAKRIVPVLNRDNKTEWLQKASQLSQRELERELVRVRPQEATPERVRFVTPTRMKLELGLSELEIKKLRRVQDLVSQAQRRAMTLEETLAAMTTEYLTRHDPLERAKRVTAKKSQSISVERQVSRPERLGPAASAGARAPIPLSILHQVNLRDRKQCVFVHPNGGACGQTRWTEIHHKKPVSQGGAHQLDNLTTLCSTHHKYVHLG